MEAEILKICASAVLCCVVGAVLGHAVGGLSAAIRIGGLALVFGGVIALLGDVTDAIRALGAGEATAEYTELMLRGLGIAVLCRLCSDVCRDCGQASVALAVESAGKIVMVLLAIPTVTDIFAVAAELLEEI